MKHPIVSVIIPVYNGEKYLKEAIDSILGQTISDFELFVINDGSVDNSAKIIKSYSDPRIKYFENKFNLGPSNARNIGIREAHGKYIALLDCDDISLPARLEKQINLLENDHTIGLCGTWVKAFDKNGYVVWRYPVNPDYLRCRMIFDNPFANSSIMIRRNILSLIDRHFDPKFQPAEDYDFWERLSKISEITNIPEILTLYRFHNKQISHSKNAIAKQKECVWEIQLRQLKEFNLNPSKVEKNLHLKLGVCWSFKASQGTVQSFEQWLFTLKESNEKHKKYPELAFLKVLGDRWFSVCNSNTPFGLWSWKTFKKSFLSKNNTNSPFSIIKFFIKCMIKKDKNND